MEYAKPWLSIDEQIDVLVRRGLEVRDEDAAIRLLREVGYYRLTGYLYPFRRSERFDDGEGRERIRVLSTFEAGACMDDAADLIDFDRELRMLVLEGIERFEIALRMQVGHSMGRVSAFSHTAPSTFVSSFTQARRGAAGEPIPSGHALWIDRVEERQRNSDEAFVAHFRSKYDDRMPIWALTEILELGHVSRLYGGLRNDIATEIAQAFGVPTKRLMQSWVACLTYVRNVAAHHARLYNRKLVSAPKRPKGDAVPLLSHLTHDEAPKDFGTYSALAVMAYLLEAVHPGRDWAVRVATLLRRFPTTDRLDVGSMGVADGWLDHELWQRSA